MQRDTKEIAWAFDWYQFLWPWTIWNDWCNLPSYPIDQHFPGLIV